MYIGSVVKFIGSLNFMENNNESIMHYSSSMPTPCTRSVGPNQALVPINFLLCGLFRQTLHKGHDILKAISILGDCKSKSPLLYV